ncbi:hypothetical protein ATANTOWER_018541 [Ataeniobius toweri]|uniref:Uncharacterized protein n=1 Tax=Ataeniobius toweri TaxID=208326 RepID=A0ABU7C327_9TELE|nr:hypothetical protein [Ataeniobius toweri]
MWGLWQEKLTVTVLGLTREVFVSAMAITRTRTLKLKTFDPGEVSIRLGIGYSCSADSAEPPLIRHRQFDYRQLVSAWSLLQTQVCLRTVNKLPKHAVSCWYCLVRFEGNVCASEQIISCVIS